MKRLNCPKVKHSNKIGIFFSKIILNYDYVFLPTYGHVQLRAVALQRPKEAWGAPGAGVTGDGELCNVGTKTK